MFAFVYQLAEWSCAGLPAHQSGRHTHSHIKFWLHGNRDVVGIKGSSRPREICQGLSLSYQHSGPNQTLKYKMHIWLLL